MLARHPDARLCSKPARRVDQNAALKGSCYAEFSSTMLPDSIVCVWPVKTPSLTFAWSVSTQFWESAMWWFAPFIDVHIWMSWVSCHESILKMWFRAQSFWMPADCQSAICLCARIHLDHKIFFPCEECHRSADFVIYKIAQMDSERNCRPSLSLQVALRLSGRSADAAEGWSSVSSGGFNVQDMKSQIMSPTLWD